ncbi:response regulator transcription factor [Phaeodactylibacter sp.]|uniref:helix-turn-helix transcriptional regulator n=1 Tax=Phaeodactylibacter sp. TaxID=1940289 RepID=UPI0025EF9E27|nr:response regulator transcription factor [Phaeodactylibacter sp.]MCI4647232.1 response regulator transcription factor [Phaeodactylibacter sp.]MCI5089304.1 response regulator transcription factor [Phaeodactylibacter sp.]
MHNLILLSDDAEFCNKSYAQLSEVYPSGHIHCYPSMGHLFEDYPYSNTSDQKVIVLIDDHLRSRSTLPLLDRLRFFLPQVSIVMNFANPMGHHIRAGIAKGVRGVVIKSAPAQRLVQAVEFVSKGKFYAPPEAADILFPIIRNSLGVQEDKFPLFWNKFDLKHREKQVAYGLINGLTYEQIATRHYVSVNTVRYYVRSLYKKTAVKNKMQLMSKLQNQVHQ